MKILKSLTFLFLLPFVLMAQPNLSLQQYVNGLNLPVDIANAGDERLFIVEQGGRIKIIDGSGSLLSTPFLQLSVNNNGGGNEQGFLGMAFHPDYANNGYFYVNYITGSGSGSSKIVRYSVDPSDPNVALSNSAYEILSLNQPYSNHNGGALKFGPDGYLYVGFGDGGSGGDPQEFSQNTQSMLGKMLRIDVNTDDSVPYVIPPTNPFVNDSDVLDEIWAIGLRNPWRYSFDRLTNDLWIGDVGQNAVEEIDMEPAGDLGGRNYGWDCREGNLNFEPNNCASDIEFTEPIISYSVGGFGNSVTGGYVYRGCEFPDMYGHYIYGDYVHARIWSLFPDGNGGWTNTQLYSGNIGISTFGEDVNGELYVAHLNGGVIYKLVTDYELEAIAYDEVNDVITAPAGYEAYQWYQNGLILNGATSQTLESVFDMGNANYYCAVTFSSGECMLNTNEIAVIGAGLEHISGLSYFSVTPNPFTDNVLLDMVMDKNISLSIDVVNVKGEVLFSLPQNTDLSIQKELNLSHLSNGVYFVRAKAKNGTVTRKIVKL